MPRIHPVQPDQTDAKTATTRKTVKAKLGMLPNLFTTLDQAPVALTGYLQLSESLGQGRLTPRQREMIAIAVAQENACEYCRSAHTAVGHGVGLKDEDIERARYGDAVDAMDDAVTELALLIVKSRGDLNDRILANARKAGLDDGLIIEIIAHVALNVLTNYVNRIAGTVVDFPVVQLSPAALRASGPGLFELTTIDRRSAMNHVLKTLMQSSAIAAAGLLGAGVAAAEGSASIGSATFNKQGELVLPEGFREWVFVGAPLTPHGLNNGKAGFPEYHHVYVNPDAFAVYQRIGEFPDGTVIAKELVLLQKGDFKDGSKNAPSGRGYFAGEFQGMDVMVKDNTRFKDTNGWGFFNFGHHAPPYLKASRAESAESCASCHTANAGKGMVFKTYYPILR